MSLPPPFSFKSGSIHKNKGFFVATITNGYSKILRFSDTPLDKNQSYLDEEVKQSSNNNGGDIN